MYTQNKRLVVILLSATFLLLLPLIAMQFTTEVNWSVSDFLIGGVLLFGLGLLIELVLRKIKTTKSRLAFILITLALFFLVWAELAVGIFGTTFAGS